jgi:hypothetical protein
MPTDPLDVPPGSLTLEAITDLLDSGGVPAGVTGDIQLNNGGAFGNASAIFPGTVLEIDSSENLIIDLSANDGGMLFTGGEILASTVGNMQFESDSGDVTFQASDGNAILQGAGVQVGAIGADVSISSDNGALSIAEDGTISLTSAGSSISATAQGDITFRSQVGNANFNAGEGNFVVLANAGTFEVLNGNMVFDATNNPSNITLQAGAAKIALSATHVNIPGLQVFANNAAAISGGLSTGDLYRTGANPDPVCVVH